LSAALAAALVLTLWAPGCARSGARVRGQTALDRGDDLAAARLLETAVAEDPDDVEAWRDLARAHMRAGRPAPAAVAIDRAAALDPRAPDIVLLRAQIRMMQGDRDGALVDARTVVARGRTAAQLEQTAVLLVRLGDADMALAAASRAVELSGGAASAYGNLAVLAVELRRPEAAERALSAGRARHPGDLGLAQTQAAFLVATGEHARAAEVYREILPRHPEPGLVHHALALLEHEAGRLEAAQRHADAAAEAFGDTRPDVLYTRIVILRDRGRTEEATRELRRARRRFPAHEELAALEAGPHPPAP
jgi:tetratricopeptide (TPR) repeat protein